MMQLPGAVILCGGQGRRMGRDKASLPFGPETLLQRVVRLVSLSAGPVVVVAARDQKLPNLPDLVKVVRDLVPDQGPLPGLKLGLEQLPTSSVFAYASATDSPLLRPGWVETLMSLIGDHDAAVVHADGFPHPLAALYRVGPTIKAIENNLESGRSSLRQLIDALPTIKIPDAEMRAIDPDLATLRNLNTEQDYQAALGEFFPDRQGVLD